MSFRPTSSHLNVFHCKHPKSQVDHRLLFSKCVVEVAENCPALPPELQETLLKFKVMVNLI